MVTIHRNMPPPPPRIFWVIVKLPQARGCWSSRAFVSVTKFRAATLKQKVPSDSKRLKLVADQQRRVCSNKGPHGSFLLGSDGPAGFARGPSSAGVAEDGHSGLVQPLENSAPTISTLPWHERRELPLLSPQPAASCRRPQQPE